MVDTESLRIVWTDKVRNKVTNPRDTLGIDSVILAWLRRRKSYRVCGGRKGV